MTSGCDRAHYRTFIAAIQNCRTCANGRDGDPLSVVYQKLSFETFECLNRTGTGAKRGRITAPNETIISFRWSAVFMRSSKELFSGCESLRKDSPMPNKEELEVRKNADATLMELATAHCIGVAILLAAADGFLLLVFGLNRVVDFSRYAY